MPRCSSCPPFAKNRLIGKHEAEQRRAEELLKVTEIMGKEKKIKMKQLISSLTLLSMWCMTEDRDFTNYTSRLDISLCQRHKNDLTHQSFATAQSRLVDRVSSSCQYFLNLPILTKLWIFHKAYMTNLSIWV